MSDLWWNSLNYSNSWVAWQKPVTARSLPPPALPWLCWFHCLLASVTVNVCLWLVQINWALGRRQGAIDRGQKNGSAIVHLLEINYCGRKE